MIRLQAELDARSIQVSQLESEMAAQAGIAASRLSELQDSFLAKIQSMRRLHQEQLTSVEQSVVNGSSSTQVSGSVGRRAGQGAPRPPLLLTYLPMQLSPSLPLRLTSCPGELGSALPLLHQDSVWAPSPCTATLTWPLPPPSCHLQSELASLKQQLQGRTGEANQLAQQLGEQQQSCKALRAQLLQLGNELLEHKEEARKSAEEAQALRTANAGLEQQVHDLVQQQLQQARSGSGSSVAGASAGSAAGPSSDMTLMLNMMEGQLGRLSQVIRAHEAEIAQLKQTLIGASEERRELTRQLEQLKAGPGTPSSTSTPPPYSPGRATSPTSSSKGALLKPYRQGPLSKPKFK